MNNALSRHNDELRNHNDFLRSLTAPVDIGNSHSVSTYASAVLNVPKTSECVQLIVKPKESFKGDTLSVIQKQVATKTHAKVIKMSKVNNGTVFVKCSSVRDSEVILQTLNNENEDILTAKTCDKNKPQIRITNILPSVDNEELAVDITNRNR